MVSKLFTNIFSEKYRSLIRTKPWYNEHKSSTLPIPLLENFWKGDVYPNINNLNFRKCFLKTPAHWILCLSYVYLLIFLDCCTKVLPRLHLRYRMLIREMWSVAMSKKTTFDSLDAVCNHFIDSFVITPCCLVGCNLAYQYLY